MKITGKVVKHYNNIDPTDVEASNACVHCDAEFTSENPCWNDEGSNEEATLHVDGVCKHCAHAGRNTHVKQLGKAVADFYDAAVTVLNAWQAAEAIHSKALFLTDYPFGEEHFAKVVYKIGKWAEQRFDNELPEDWEVEDNNDEFPKQEEPKVD